MPTNREKQRIRELAQKGQSINQIKDQLELPKSTVYYHFKKEVGQKQKTNQPEIPDDPEFKGELCGIFAGDGNYYYEEKNYKYRIKFTLNINDNYWEDLAEYLTEKLGKESNTNPQPDYNRINLRYESKKLYKFLKKNLEWEEGNKSETVRLKEKNYSEDFKKGFIRGLIDTDGTKLDEYRCYKVGTISKDLMKQTSSFLEEIDIGNTLFCVQDKRENCRDMYRINIYGDDAEKLGKEIKPRHPKKQFEGV